MSGSLERHKQEADERKHEAQERDKASEERVEAHSKGQRCIQDALSNSVFVEALDAGKREGERALVEGASTIHDTNVVPEHETGGKQIEHGGEVHKDAESTAETARDLGNIESVSDGAVDGGGAERVVQEIADEAERLSEETINEGKDTQQKAQRHDEQLRNQSDV